MSSAIYPAPPRLVTAVCGHGEQQRLSNARLRLTFYNAPVAYCGPARPGSAFQQSGSSDLHRPRAVRWRPRGRRRSVGRGGHRPAIESRESQSPGADAVSSAEGNTNRRNIASAWSIRRGRRTWHVQTLFAREPGDLAIDRSATAAGPHREGEEP